MTEGRRSRTVRGTTCPAYRFYMDGMALRDWFAGQALIGTCTALMMSRMVGELRPGKRP